MLRFWGDPDQHLGGVVAECCMSASLVLNPMVGNICTIIDFIKNLLSIVEFYFILFFGTTWASKNNNVGLQ